MREHRARRGLRQSPMESACKALMTLSEPLVAEADSINGSLWSHPK
jgi:hypothetical protein